MEEMENKWEVNHLIYDMEGELKTILAKKLSSFEFNEDFLHDEPKDSGVIELGAQSAICMSPNSLSLRIETRFIHNRTFYGHYFTDIEEGYVEIGNDPVLKNDKTGSDYSDYEIWYEIWVKKARINSCEKHSMTFFVIKRHESGEIDEPSDIFGLLKKGKITLDDQYNLMKWASEYLDYQDQAEVGS